MENSLRASSATSHWFLAWIYCSKLWQILMTMVTSWSHCWAKPTVECSVYLLSRINFSSTIAPKSSFLRRLVQWHIQQHDEPKENNFILNCYTKMNLMWFLKWCLKIFLWQFVQGVIPTLDKSTFSPSRIVVQIWSRIWFLKKCTKMFLQHFKDWQRIKFQYFCWCQVRSWKPVFDTNSKDRNCLSQYPSKVSSDKSKFLKLRY